MKKNLLIRLLIPCLVSAVMCNSALAQADDSEPAFTSMSFAMSPVIQGFTTTLTVSFINNGNNVAYAIPAGGIHVNISLPTSGEYGPANTANPVASLGGSYYTAFSWTYNTVTHTFVGSNIAPIGPGAGGTIVVTVKGILSSLSQVISTANIQKLVVLPNNQVGNDVATAGLAVSVGGPLSVSLLNFNATPQGKSVYLDWQTSSEINSNHFDVETSIDGVKFNKIGAVTAAGNSTTTSNYSFLHTTPINGLNYYRLKQVDQDGSFKYSVIRTVKFGNLTQVYPMPNPTTDGVALISNVAGTVQSVGVYSMDGKMMQQISNYSYGQTIDMSRYAPATYILKLINKDGSTQVFQVLKK